MNIVVVSPHPDDAELGMGGTIARLRSEGHDVLIADLTDGEPTPMGSREKRQCESAAADVVLGCRRTNLGLANRQLEHTLAARHALAEVLRIAQCEILFAPHPLDAHPDHIAATRIAADARFDAKLTNCALRGEPIYPRKLIHYYCTHLRAMPDPTFALDISAWTDRKRDAILAYRSQVLDHAPNRGLIETIRARDQFVGSRLGVAAAEPFWCGELIGFTSLPALL